MAFSKGDILAEIRHHYYTVNEHIVKLLLFPNSKHIHKTWVDSVQTHIYASAKMKWTNNNKYLPAPDYYREYFIKPFENDDDYEFLDELVSGVIDENSDLPTDYSGSVYPKDKWVEILKSFYMDLSNTISSGKLNKSKLGAMIRQYFIGYGG